MTRGVKALQSARVQIIALLLCALAPLALLPQGGSFCLCAPAECACGSACQDQDSGSEATTSCCCCKASATAKSEENVAVTKTAPLSTPHACKKLKVSESEAADILDRSGFELPDLTPALSCGGTLVPQDLATRRLDFANTQSPVFANLPPINLPLTI
ncbi:MAG: hypothetical protein V3W41_15470 [Planctomycetota bacterium]